MFYSSAIVVIIDAKQHMGQLYGTKLARYLCMPHWGTTVLWLLAHKVD